MLELKNNPLKLAPVALSPIFSNKAKSLKRSVLALVKSRLISSSSHSKDFRSPNKSRNSSSGEKSPAQIKTTSLHNPQHKQANNLISPQMSSLKAQVSTKSLFGSPQTFLKPTGANCPQSLLNKSELHEKSSTPFLEIWTKRFLPILIFLALKPTCSNANSSESTLPAALFQKRCTM